MMIFGSARFQRITRMSASTLSLLQRVTAMISALFVTAAAAQQTPPQPQQAPTTTPALAPRELPPVIARWQQAVVARLAHFQRYPAQAKGATGVVNLNFSIDRQGHVLNSEIINSSGSAVLDAEALSDMYKWCHCVNPSPLLGVKRTWCGASGATVKCSRAQLPGRRV